MNTKTKLTSVVFATALSLIAGGAFADKGQGQGQERAKSQRATAMNSHAQTGLRRAGILGALQFRAARQAAKTETLARFDRDHDGKLSEAERAVMRSERTVARFRVLDLNQDQVLIPSELPGKSGEGTGRFAKLDLDGDGQITLSELEAAGTENHGQRQREERIESKGKSAEAKLEHKAQGREAQGKDKSPDKLERGEAPAEVATGKPTNAGKPMNAGKPTNAGKPMNAGKPPTVGKPEVLGQQRRASGPSRGKAKHQS